MFRMNKKLKVKVMIKNKLKKSLKNYLHIKCTLFLMVCCLLINIILESSLSFPPYQAVYVSVCCGSMLVQLASCSFIEQNRLFLNLGALRVFFPLRL